MTKQQFKEELNRVFDDNLHTKQWHNIVDWTIITLIIISTIEIFLSTFDGISERYGNILRWVDIITQIFFTIEVTLRIWNADMLDPKYKGFVGRLRYCFSFYGLIDLLATYLFYLNYVVRIPVTIFKTLRVVRLLRVFRYMHSFQLLSKALKSKKNELLVSLNFLVIVTMLLSFVLFFVEHEVQPEVYGNGWSSVIWAFAQYIGDPGGFADMPPMTFCGKVVACLVGIMGIAIVAVPAGLVGSAFTDVMEEEKHEEKINENIQRIVHAFKFEKDQQHTNFFYVPRYKPLNTILTRKFIPENDIIEAVEQSDCLHIINLAETQNRQDNPVDKIVIVNFFKNTPYGCCIDRGSKVTIVNTSGNSEPMTGWLAYHIAKIGGFNYVAREIETDNNNPQSYYNITDVNACPNLPLFLSDIDRLSAREDSWVISILESLGVQKGENRRKEHLHFCYASKKHDDTYNDPSIRIKDLDLFEQMYQDMSKVMNDMFGYICDKNEWYAVNPQTNFSKYIKSANVFTLRIETIVHVFASNSLSAIKTIADVLNRNFEPDVTKSYPPEMLKRPIGKDFGMQDYVC